ncbi:hypothetical protein F4778DRAFT_952 [Xylariomycetidae sp. FL2044]|nr:hypothetical protein F4778DRAFT_952 [Xylariomycetidae sp. FL2044]
MVSLKSPLLPLSLALTATTASAWITSMTAPPTAVAGSTIDATITAAIYVQNWDDFGIVWGLKPAAQPSCGGDDVCIGQRIQYTPLFPDHLPPLGNSTVAVTIPAGQPAGDYQLFAAVPHLVGASGLIQISSFNQSISITAADK